MVVVLKSGLEPAFDEEDTDREDFFDGAAALEAT